MVLNVVTDLDMPGFIRPISVNVRDFGAVGNGTTDDSAAFQAAINYIASKGGGTLLVPPGTYVVTTPVKLCSNLIIEGTGAVLTKPAGAADAVVFYSSSGTNAYYGGGASRIRVRGLRFKGSIITADNLLVKAFSLHHTQDIIVERCTFDTIMPSGHALDLGACDGVLVRDCTFIGSNPQTEDEVRDETIQVDCSYIGPISGPAATAGDTCSGLMTKNVTVENCRFLPVTIGGVDYPCPTPIGSHNLVEGKWYENIKFLRNMVIDPAAGPSSSESESSTAAVAFGVIHGGQWRNVQIVGNIFRQSQPRSRRVLAFYSRKYGITAASSPQVTPTIKAAYAAPVQARDIIITDNLIEGFLPAAGETVSSLIFLKGDSSTGGEIVNVVVERNTIRDGWNSAATIGSQAVTVNYGLNVKVNRNIVTNMWRGVTVSTCTSCELDGNTVTTCYDMPFFLGGMVGFTVDRNIVRGAANYFRINGTACKDGSVSGNKIMDPTAAASGSLSIAGGDALMIANNQVINRTGSTYAYGMAFGNGTGLLTNSVITGNKVMGFTAKTSGTPDGTTNVGTTY